MSESADKEIRRLRAALEVIARREYVPIKGRHEMCNCGMCLADYAKRVLEEME